jgi:hypothetical protein
MTSEESSELDTCAVEDCAQVDRDQDAVDVECAELWRFSDVFPVDGSRTQLFGEVIDLGSEKNEWETYRALQPYPPSAPLASSAYKSPSWSSVNCVAMSSPFAAK